jgi:hypothetical protein
VISRGRTAAVALLAASTLASCATVEYGPLDGEAIPKFGYRASSVEAGRYTLLLVGPPTADRAQVHAMWDRRARELCGHDRYTKTIFRAEQVTELYQYYGGRPGALHLEGFLACN